MSSSFGLPENVDSWLTIQFIVFFLIGFIINVYSNGQATLIFFENEYSISPDIEFNSSNSNFLYVSDRDRLLKEYSQKISYRTNFALYSNLFFYWVLSPLINFYFAFFVFKKGHFKKIN